MSRETRNHLSQHGGIIRFLPRAPHKHRILAFQRHLFGASSFFVKMSGPSKVPEHVV